ncbi:MAG: hypothetical protein JO084_06170 [Bradyrhizobiaceae bacterium]|nr:hypothetical protein [Bradyrhizobiaceae bacterium]
MPASIAVIPGRAEGASPESMNTDQASSAGPVFMGSGLAASRRPGMTAARMITGSLPRLQINCDEAGYHGN